MGYMHIDNLYRSKNILLFKECFALEKVHGTSAHINWNGSEVTFFSGENHALFCTNFNLQELTAKFQELYGSDRVTIYGEAYGGNCQRMRNTYGDKFKFVAFDVKYYSDPEDKVGYWLNVPAAEAVTQKFGIEFVHYVRIPATVEDMDKERDADSVQAIRNGVGTGKKREGIVVRPLIELKYGNGGRIIAKHKRDDYAEVKSPRIVTDEELKVIKDAEEAADEFVTAMRLEHVLQRFPQDIGIEKTKDVIEAMVEDVYREGKGEIIESKELRGAICKKTALMFKNRLKLKLTEVSNADANVQSK